MPARTGYVVKGGPELQRAFDRFGDRLVNDMKGVNQEIANEVAEEARQRVPFGADEGGHLRDTIRGKGYKRSAQVWAGDKRHPYAGPIHFGWARRNIEPQPFLYDALDNRRNEVIDAYGKQIQKLIARFYQEAPHETP